MLSWFESRLEPTAGTPSEPPTGGLVRFYWHFLRQMPGLLAALFATGFAVAVLDLTIPLFIGRVVTLVSGHRPERLLAEAGPQLLAMALVFLVGRPVALLAQFIVTNQIINPGLTNLVRWQSHWHVVRQSWTFFQNDFAGRIANRVIQSGPALRESVVAGTNAVWYIIVYGASSIALLSATDRYLAIPIVCWFAAYALLLLRFVPRLRERSRVISEARSALTGRVVDSYSNILTVKLFARARDEDAFVREAVDQHTAAMRRQSRLATGFSMLLALLNAALVVATGAAAIVLFRGGHIGVGVVATALPMAWQISNMAGWVAQNVNSIFENVGVVQDAMRSIAVTRQMPDAPDARALRVSAGQIRFEAIHFDYGRDRGAPVLHGIDLAIAPGERVGVVGPSGAGKSTLLHLLLRFHEPARGRILIDGQDIATVSQETLRGQIAMVTQDTALLHRSVADNIRYGRPEASAVMIEEAARRAQAHDFILGLEDWLGRRGYDAHVGERGVKLSGGQRQRIAIARVILKDVPILVLDEATSALDSEVEAAIQDQLDTLMEGRTVIAIAHRLSTIARMDRLVVLDRGRIREIGTHAQLLAVGGLYAQLWRRQSGGFLADCAPALGRAAIVSGLPARAAESARLGHT
ncbi:MAG TPA: ABC transporter ATP-binding protein [Steroidobacteraceae bacterium]|jgi:ATP-binding cassette subfamily B multidrug efflux pump|nr:ABC transporter ATP-binding protein [Steroidobacteraceae bacterium]